MTVTPTKSGAPDLPESRAAASRYWRQTLTIVNSRLARRATVWFRLAPKVSALTGNDKWHRLSRRRKPSRDASAYVLDPERLAHWFTACGRDLPILEDDLDLRPDLSENPIGDLCPNCTGGATSE